MSAKSKILLESGTNELEIMVFTIDNEKFGINVSKVVEIILNIPPTPMPNAGSYIEGVIKPRDQVFTLINLPLYLNRNESKDPERDIYIITHFNKNYNAFHVHTVEGIRRLEWTQIEKPDEAIYGSEEGLATGIAHVGDELITILDFEKIMTELSPENSFNPHDVLRLGERPIDKRPILLVDDSPTLNRMIKNSLTQAGYVNVLTCSNGGEAWEFLEEAKAKEGDVLHSVAMVITDLEMPRMDGHRLTKLMKEDDVFSHIPIIYFSSLINREMFLKGKNLGATAQVTKPDIVELIKAIDTFL